MVNQDYDAFRKTSFYRSLDPLKKLEVGMYFLDPANTGLSWRELRDRLNGTLSVDYLHTSLALGEELKEISRGWNFLAEAGIPYYSLTEKSIATIDAIIKQSFLSDFKKKYDAT